MCCDDGHSCTEKRSKVTVFPTQDITQTFGSLVSEGLKCFEYERCKVCNSKLTVQGVSSGPYLFLDCCNFILENTTNLVLPETVKVCDMDYKVLGLIRHRSMHFVPIVKADDDQCYVLNDMNDDASKDKTLFECCRRLCTIEGNAHNPLIGLCLVLLEKIECKAEDIPLTSGKSQYTEKVTMLPVGLDQGGGGCHSSKIEGPKLCHPPRFRTDGNF